MWPLSLLVLILLAGCGPSEAPHRLGATSCPTRDDPAIQAVMTELAARPGPYQVLVTLAAGERGDDEQVDAFVRRLSEQQDVTVVGQLSVTPQWVLRGELTALQQVSADPVVCSLVVDRFNTPAAPATMGTDQ